MTRFNCTFRVHFGVHAKASSNARNATKKRRACFTVRFSRTAFSSSSANDQLLATETLSRARLSRECDAEKAKDVRGWLFACGRSRPHARRTRVTGYSLAAWKRSLAHLVSRDLTSREFTFAVCSVDVGRMSRDRRRCPAIVSPFMICCQDLEEAILPLISRYHSFSSSLRSNPSPARITRALHDIEENGCLLYTS